MFRIAIVLVLIIFNSFGSLYAMDIWPAVRNGNTQKVEQLIQQDNTLVNTRGYFNKTPLHNASVFGHTEIAALLLQHKADVNAQNRWQQTPLHEASKKGHTKSTETAALLLQHKANVNAQDDYKWTPLHYASTWSPTETIKLLLSYGATPHKPINLFAEYEKYSQTYAQRYESWICKTFVSRKIIVTLLSLIGRKIKVPLPKDMRNLIASYAISDQEREREESSQNSNHQDPVQEWEQFKKNNPNIAALARIELP